MVRRTLFVVAFLCVIAALPAPAQAQCSGAPIPPGLNRGPCVYSVKFVCGLQQPVPNLQPPLEPPVKPGNYATAVNIHNFHNNQSVPIVKKAVIANSENQHPGEISPFRKLVLQPDQALEIDCPDIVSLLQTNGAQLPAFIKGFVEVVSPVLVRDRRLHGAGMRFYESGGWLRAERSGQHRGGSAHRVQRSVMRA